MMFAYLLSMVAQQATVTPTPPPIVSTSVFPPPIIVSRIAQPIRAEMLPAVPVEVRITAGDRLLYFDTLRVARGAGASYSENRSEASALLCPDAQSYDRSERTSLSVNLYWRDSGSEAPGVNVTVNWQRPQSGTDCAPVGSRGIQVSQSVRLAPGESAVIKGDAGLTVRLTRR